ncbi:MAG: N-acetylglutaminylglutamine synthetase [Burkholderiaceae bacterium]|nr:N-acetylglutaminylglutamine synthetase [Burkholderiaceae bacterium]
MVVDSTTQHRRGKRPNRAGPAAGAPGEGRFDQAVAVATHGRAEATLDCGWGRLLFSQTFESAAELVEGLRDEAVDRRDIAFYVSDPHVLISLAPQELFLDPSHTYRLDLDRYRGRQHAHPGFFVRRLGAEADAEAVNRIYALHGMVPVAPEFFWSRRDSRALGVLVAEDSVSGEILGTVMGVDHVHAFGDPSLGSSLWCLAADPQSRHPGIGAALVRHLAEHYRARGCAYLDLSVMHDNEPAIALYERLGFRRVPVFAVKRKNSFNERLYTGAGPGDELNPYARIVIDEAMRRGIRVELIDAPGGMFRLSHGGRSVRCRESLSELTSAVAMSICDDKAAARRIVAGAGVQVPAQMPAGDARREREFLEAHRRVVVKPSRGEQGRGIAVGIETIDELRAAVDRARRVDERVLIEEMVEGEDLRLVVIDYRLVAAAIRRRPEVVGDGRLSLRRLIERQSRRRAAATDGESTIPIDAETTRTLGLAGLGLDDVVEEGRVVTVRGTANLHAGGTIHDVTDEVHPVLVGAAIRTARVIGMPVVGVDLMVRSPRQPGYAFIEANERPGLANHEPQPTAQRFIDLLFPQTVPASARRATESARAG